MALSDGENMVMPVAPAYGGSNGMFGGDWAWIILLLLLGWGNNGNGFGGGNNSMYPWMNQLDATNAGFQNAQLARQLSAIQASLNANQMSDLQRSFDAQTAVTGGLTNISSQLAQCCCENRLATANLQSVIQSENCADRAALSDGIRDIITNQTANTQRILDQMCNDKIDAKNEKIADLERQLQMASLAASQIAQTAQIEQFITNNGAAAKASGT